jgi:hypothetical protein
MDTRVEQIFKDTMEGDNSFRSNAPLLLRLFGGVKYTQDEMRENYYRGIKFGIEVGLRNGSLEGQKVGMYRNIENSGEKNEMRVIEFLDKFYAMAGEYEMGIKYHPQHGLVVVDLHDYRKQK